MKGLASIASGRRGKWALLAVWLLAVIAMQPLGAKLTDETSDDTLSFLPESAESTEVVRILDEQFEAGETTTGLIVYERDAGLSGADRSKIIEDAERIQASGEVPLTEDPAAPFGRQGPIPGLVSEDRTVAFTVLTVPTDFENAADWGKSIREIVDREPNPGLEVVLTGDLGFSVDAEEVFGDLDLKLVLATATLVLFLLGVIYRAVLIALTPLLVVVFAYFLATAFVYLYAKSGATVSSNSIAILIVLMFGVGTDYSLLLVSRYREELHRLADKHDAMSRALRRTGPTIIASGMTTTLAMLVLGFADARLTNTLGPVAAIGVATAMVAAVTLLPALLTIFGRRGFWPRQGTVAYDPDHAYAARRGVWRRIGDRVLERPGAALTVTVVAFGAAALGLLAYKVDYSTTTFFKKSVESVEGFRTLEESFPAGLLAPTTVLVQREDARVEPGDVARAERQLRAVEGVASVTPTGRISENGQTTSIEVVLERDPFTKPALNLVPRIRESVRNLAPGASALVGGGAATQYDFDETIESDLRLIVPLALLVIAIVLTILLRALVAPLVLIASVIVSFLATLGLSILFIRFVVGDAGLDASIPTFAFIFLVALGIDYTIFLMGRVREEARKHGTREGTLRALAATGPVITSAGIILAGTFSVLMTLPVTFTFDLGFMVALGVLLDTFIVRTIMVPAAVELLGDRVWWPSTPKEAGGLREETGERRVPGARRA